MSKEEENTLFENLWKLYPHNFRGNKTQALKAWQKINLTSELVATMMDAIAKQIRWRETANGEFRPVWKNVSTWLNNNAWEDEVETEGKIALVDYKGRKVTHRERLELERKDREANGE